MKKRFRLSCRGQVAAALTLSLIYAPLLWAGGIVPAPGSNVDVRQAASGADVVQIVGTNQHGLSHNRYNAHDVSKAGAVYNNAVAPGQSQLAGQLGANSKLGGRAAKVILNEVISRNPSLLLGQMEVFGQAADLVLVNPNGITCNGCGFINTRRAALVVGSTLLQDGRLQALTSAGSSAHLTVEDGITANRALDLIAPRINAQGALVAISGIHAVIGQAQMEYDTREAAAKGAAPAERLDSAFLGGMQAGQISIVSTDDGAGVNLAGAIRGDGRIKVETQGRLGLGDTYIKGERVTLAAKTIDATPQTRYEEQVERQHDESWFIWKTGETKVAEREMKTHVDRALLEGDHVSLRAQEMMHLNAAEIRGGDIGLHGGDIALTGSETHDGYSTDRADWLNSWQHSHYTENSRYRQQGVVLAAERNLVLNAQGGIKAQGAVLSAKGDVRMTAGKEIALSGLAERTVMVDRGDRYLEGPSLSSGKWNQVYEKQQLKQSEIAAGQNLLLRAADDVTLQSVKVHTGGDAVIRSETRVDIATQVVNQSQAQDKHTTHWGGIGGSDRANGSNQETLNVPSEIRAQGALRVEAGQDIHIVGSTVKGERGARAVTRHGSVQVEHATDLTQSLIDERRGGAFDIQTQRRYDNEAQQVVQSAQLASDTNLMLVSGENVAIRGSQVNAGGALTVQAGGDIRVEAAAAEQRQQRDDNQLGWTASAGADARNPGAYRAGVGLSQTETHATQTRTTQTSAVLTGGSVRLDAGGSLTVQGSQVAARDGDASLQGRQLTVDAAYETQRDTLEKGHIGNGIFVAASWDQLRGGMTQEQANEYRTSDARTPKVSQVSASGDLALHALGALQTEGAQFGAGGQLSVQAGTIDNRAAVGTSTSTLQSGGGSGDVAAVLEFGGLLKPVQTMLDKAQQGQLAEAARDAAKIKDQVLDGVDKAKRGDWAGIGEMVSQIATPSAGGLIDITGQRQDESASSQSAVGSRFEAAGVSVQSAGSLHDEATQYRATRDKVEMAAGEHRFDAVMGHTERAVEGGSGSAMLELTTLTGEDLRLKASGNGSEHWQQKRDTQVDGGAIRGAGGVAISVAGDASYRGTTVDGGQGQLAVTTGGALRVEAAQHSASNVEGRQGGSLALSARSVPQAQGESTPSKLSGGLDAGGIQGKVGMDVARQQENRQEALPAQWSADAGVALHAGGDISLTGTKIVAAEGRARLPSVSLSSGGQIEMAATATSSRQNSWDLSGNIQGEAYAGARPSSGQIELKSHQRNESRDGGLPSTIDARQVTVESQGDLRLNGARVGGDRVSAQVGGDLHVESRKDDNRLRQGSLEANVGSPNLGQIFSGADTARSNGQYEQSRLDAVSQASGLYGQERLDAQVAGRTVLTGGQLQSGQGPVATGGPVIAHSVPGQFDSNSYNVNFDGTLTELANGLARDVLMGKAPLGWVHQKQHEDRTALPAR